MEISKPSQVEGESVIELKINLKAIKADGATLSERFENESKNTSDVLLEGIYLAYARYLKHLEDKKDKETIDFLSCMSSSDNCITRTFLCGSCGRTERGRLRITDCSNGEHVRECIGC